MKSVFCSWYFYSEEFIWKLRWDGQQRLQNEDDFIKTSPDGLNDLDTVFYYS